MLWSKVFDATVPLAENQAAFNAPVQRYSPSTNTIGYGHLLVPNGNLVKLIKQGEGTPEPTDSIMKRVKEAGITDRTAWRVYTFDKADAARRLLQSIKVIPDGTPAQISALVELCFMRGFLTPQNSPKFLEYITAQPPLWHAAARTMLEDTSPAWERFRASCNYPKNRRLARIAAQLQGA